MAYFDGCFYGRFSCCLVGCLVDSIVGWLASSCYGGWVRFFFSSYCLDRLCSGFAIFKNLSLLVKTAAVLQHYDSSVFGFCPNTGWSLSPRRGCRVQKLSCPIWVPALLRETTWNLSGKRWAVRRAVSWLLIRHYQVWLKHTVRDKRTMRLTNGWLRLIGLGLELGLLGMGYRELRTFL